MCTLSFWIVRPTEEDKQHFSFEDSFFADDPLKQIDKWTEFLGPDLVVDWVRIFGVPLHVWRKELMCQLGELIGVVEEVNDCCIQMEVAEFLQLKIIRPCAVVVPQTLWLDMGGVRYQL